jgi:hypothetical protein
MIHEPIKFILLIQAHDQQLIPLTIELFPSFLLTCVQIPSLSNKIVRGRSSCVIHISSNYIISIPWNYSYSNQEKLIIGCGNHYPYYVTIYMMLEYSSHHKVMSSIVCTNSVVYQEFS